MQIVPMKPEHLVELLESNRLMQKSEHEFTSEYIDMLCKEQSFAGVVDGHVVICAGIIKHEKEKGEAWAFVSCETAKHYISAFRAIKRYLDFSDFSRVQAVVNYGYEHGYRLVESLGFKMEAPRMANYHGIGRDASLFAYTKDK